MKLLKYAGAVSLAITLCFVSTTKAKPKILRGTDLTSQEWSEITGNKAEAVVVEFREGDEIPLNFTSEGDFLETVQASLNYLRVKRSFWMQLHNDQVEVSLDGINFKPLSEIASGSLSLGAGSNLPGVPVNTINIVLKAYLK